MQISNLSLLTEVALEFAETLYRAREGIPSVGVVIVGTGSIAHELTFRVVPRTFSEYSPLPVQTNLFASSMYVYKPN